ncbi:hypothetical protein [Methylobacterium sp. SyP6R]|uniref:hypothetical protein n=1 Tax=Methylobacterium sp. SyP6R TaxID=2718876 RepID=UPI001F1E4DF9|nr:hypothetical protein [Methylobacterium sp. SyP6R]MCF4125195.1 hypothetical protein [Methylobacterium sp. SyP6R]
MSGEARDWPSMALRFRQYKLADLVFSYLFDGRDNITDQLRCEITDLISNILFEYSLDMPEESAHESNEMDGKGRFRLTSDFTAYLVRYRPERGGPAGTVLRERLETLAREPWGGLVPVGVRHGPGGRSMPKRFRRAPRR